MNPKLLGMLAGFGILAGGVVVVSNLGGKDGTVGEPVARIERLAPTEAEVVDRAVRASNNKLVHVVGVDVAKDSVVGDTAIGRAVVVDAVKNSSECSVVFEAGEVTKEITDIHGTGKATITRVDLDPVKFSRGTFVKRGGEDKVKKTWIWNALLVGQECKDIALEPGYLGSSMQELLALPEAMKAKILRTYGMCLDVGIDGKLNKEGKTHRCDVPYGDPRAINAEEIFFPHNFSGREHDLGIMPKKNSEVQKRYATPDGGFREVTADPVKEVIK